MASPPPQKHRVINRATIFYATAVVSIGILIFTTVSFALLALLVASPLLLLFSPILLPAGLAIAASTAAFTTVSVITVILALWWFVASFRKKVTGVVRSLQRMVSEVWESAKKVCPMLGHLECRQGKVRWVGDIVSEAGKRVKDNKIVSSIKQTVDKTVAGGVVGSLSILGEVRKKLSVDKTVAGGAKVGLSILGEPGKRLSTDKTANGVEGGLNILGVGKKLSVEKEVAGGVDGGLGTLGEVGKKPSIDKTVNGGGEEGVGILGSAEKTVAGDDEGGLSYLGAVEKKFLSLEKTVADRVGGGLNTLGEAGKKLGHSLH